MAVKRALAAKDEADRVRKILGALRKAYPDPKTALEFSNPLELLVATVLSAQCTDERVNQVTRTLFKKHRTAADYAGATQAAMEKAVKSTGFFRQKSSAIRAFCQELIERHGGDVPKTMEDMTALTGVGRKTANLVLGQVYGRPGVVVDTHVKRVSTRLGLTENKDPDKIEQDLMAVIPKRQWLSFGDRLIWHGRRVCAARKPRCADCVLNTWCPSSTV